MAQNGTKWHQMAQDGTQQFPFLGSLPQQLPTEGKKKKKKKSKGNVCYPE